jgi:subtilisin family serine protease
MTMSGTSMAAPHITGIAAIIFSGFPRLTGVEVKQILMRATRQTNAAALAPDNTWGLSKIDFTAAIGLAGNAVFPTITGVAVQNTIISWTTDVPTTAELRYHTHRRQLQLGKFAGSRAILKLATSHQIDLADLPPRPLL